MGPRCHEFALPATAENQAGGRSKAEGQVDLRVSRPPGWSAADYYWQSPIHHEHNRAALFSERTDRMHILEISGRIGNPRIRQRRPAARVLASEVRSLCSRLDEGVCVRGGRHLGKATLEDEAGRSSAGPDYGRSYSLQGPAICAGFIA